MKRLLSISIALILLATPISVLAQTATPTPTESLEENRAQIEELKERLATKVAELRTLVKRAIYGTIVSVSLTSATVDTKTKQMKIELTDDVGITQVIRGKRTDLTVDDLAQDDVVTVFGNYDDTLDLLQAKYIFIENPSNAVRESGTVTEIDDEENTITVKTREGRNIIVDIERTTATSAWSKENGIEKSGFSGIQQGVIVHVEGTPVANTENRLSAIRILDLGFIIGQAPTPTLTETPAEEASRPAATE